MTVRKILTEPNKVLRQVSKNVDKVRDEENNKPGEVDDKVGMYIQGPKISSN